MRLLRARIGKVGGSSGLLNGLDVEIRRRDEADATSFQPLCLIGPNGSGKSQFLQLIAEFMQAALHPAVPTQERREVDPTSEFGLTYLLQQDGGDQIEVELEGTSEAISIRSRRQGEDWPDWKKVDESSAALLPARVVGYTSGENETLSLPFLASRAAYADEITTMALPKSTRNRPRGTQRQGRSSYYDPTPKELRGETPRLMLIDYSTHLEVLVANLMLGSPEQREFLLNRVKLRDLRSMRCVVSLNHGAVRNSVSKRADSKRKGVQLTEELEGYIDALKSCAATWHYSKSDERYTFDFWVDSESRKAFSSTFGSAFDCYLALHKLALLNDLAISRDARLRFDRDIERRRFATRLPEPPDEDKVFRIEELTFCPSEQRPQDAVDYVSLSDGEHQLVQILGVFAMVDEPNVLFLLDEPESHLNPQWRVNFMSDLASLPTANGKRAEEGSAASAQEAFITTHAPFVPSDTPRNHTLVFRRSEPEDLAPSAVMVSRPNIQTFGARYDEILEACFLVYPPISAQPLEVIDELMQSQDATEVEDGLKRLGPSTEKVKLIDHLQQLKGN